MGSRGLRKKAYARFAIKVDMLSIFPSKLPLINLRMNNRNHRKIVVIDGQIGYVGGFNVGDEYLGKSKIRLLARYAFTNCRGCSECIAITIYSRLEFTSHT